MMGRIVGGLFIQHGGKTRRCFCRECVHARSTRAKEKRQWKREQERPS